MNNCQRCGREVPDNIMICNECMGYGYQEERNEYQTEVVPKKKGLPTGAIVGIILGAVSVLAGAVVLAVMTLQVKSIDITDSDVYMDVGDEHMVTYVLEPANTFQKDVVFSSSDTNVVTVDEDGRITAIGDGEATIEVSSKNGHTDSMTIVVSQLFSDWKWESTYSESDDEYYYNSAVSADLEITEDRFWISTLDIEFEGTWKFDGYDEEYLTYDFYDDDGGHYLVLIDDDLLSVLLISDPAIVLFFRR